MRLSDIQGATNWSNKSKNEGATRDPKPLKIGTKVTVPHRGRTVSGKIVRYDPGTPEGYSPMYTVYIGDYASLIVPSHEVKPIETKDMTDISSYMAEGDVISLDAHRNTVMSGEFVQWLKHNYPDMTLKEFSNPIIRNKLHKEFIDQNNKPDILEDKMSVSTLGGFPVTPLNIEQQGVDEALQIDIPQKPWDKKDLQAYLTRIKKGEKTKADRFKPIIHASNIKAITKDDANTEWDLDDLASQITTPPNSILGTNAKMAKSKKEGVITYDLTLPALNGIVVDEEASSGGEPVFVEVTTCPGAGECKTYCYPRKGGYVMFPNSSMSAARALNFLLNHPKDYMKMFDSEVKQAKARVDKAGIDLLVRIHDAGDFFSKQYYDLMMDVVKRNPDIKFYFYSKIGDVVTNPNTPPNVVNQFSPGAQSREIKKVQAARAKGQFVKNAFTLQKEFFRGLFKTNEKGKYVKDNEGRTVLASPEAWDQFKDKLASQYKIDKDSIITYDQMVKIKEPGPIGYKNKLQTDGKIVQVPEYAPPKWNVVVFPAGHGDLGAPRKDVQNQFLMFH